jgi:alkanesulfonate monooxygenase SsuD/methylene tetrahydromethanopterin reductase-like flavin-dependent oxidoreductase (luciferase family)
MQFGLFFLMQRDPAWSEAAVYEAEVAQMLAAEAHGFDSVWIAEHHFSNYGVCPAPPVLAAHVAARTERLRVGMGVTLLPLHDPVLIAEQLAVLDLISGGRLDVGIGRGGTEREYHAFGAAESESRARVEEGIDLIRRCWTGEPVSFNGRFRTLENIRVGPLPAQRPHPPLYIAANSPNSNEFAARQGLPTLSSFFVPAAELQRRHAAYRDTALAAGQSTETVEDLMSRAWGMRVVHVAADHATAVRTVEAPFMSYQRQLAMRRNEGVGARLPNSFDGSLLRLRPFSDYLDEGLAAIGGPDEVVDSLGRYIEATGYRRILLLMALPGLPAADALRSMELFATRVMPQLNGLAFATSERGNLL